jgi:hypothetical protein
MTAAEILRHCRQRGTELISQGNALRYRGPEVVLPPELLQALRINKSELLDALNTEAHINRLIKSACQGLSITPEQLRPELEDGDLQDLASGALTPHGLRLVAKSSTLRYP